MFAFWLALAVFGVAVVVAAAYAVARGLELWRLVKRTGAILAAETERISRTTAQIESHLANASAAAGRLHEANERLAVARARLDVQRAALREARAQMRRVFWFVPGI
ncbi:hypothetical protein Gocc_2308 [Gaiella occulta]|uniref:Uncharacterized protein n=1 Tax=Gaiella occulta TaxID=1002870 RepID=A0A7M2YV56_9ACTN|nr:hypothetical protein [Gaiella occulta]RDI73744.1 hypothetical protein Gocc_2308 [Gaiella occulta]